MPVSNPNKTVSNSTLACDGLTTVTLSFDATPRLRSNPADIVLIMDRSKSMTGRKLTAAKAAAKNLIQTVAKASGSADGSAIINESRLGLVTFAGEAVAAVDLTNDVAALNNAVDAMEAKGSTNHKEAFEAAFTMMQPSTSRRQIVILFTDGITSVGGDPIDVTDNMKAMGLEIYCIGMIADPSELNTWASAPIETHVAYAFSSSQVQSLFTKVAAEVVEAGSLDMVIQEVVHPDFKIVHVNTPTHGTTTLVNPQTLEWKADFVGAAGEETASLSFDVMHIGQSGGVKSVNQSITYTDRAGVTLTFPDPKVTIVCDESPAEIVEPCPLPAELIVAGCQDAAVVFANDTVISGLGRIVQVDALVKNVCPGKRVGVAVLLSELDDQGVEHARGTKTLLIPPREGNTCQDVQLKCISFVVPEVLDVSGNTDSICNPRKFNVRVMANYVDTDFVCCDAQAVL